jgi:hypothetical protein
MWRRYRPHGVYSSGIGPLLRSRPREGRNLPARPHHKDALRVSPVRRRPTSQLWGPRIYTCYSTSGEMLPRGSATSAKLKSLPAVLENYPYAAEAGHLNLATRIFTISCRCVSWKRHQKMPHLRRQDWTITNTANVHFSRGVIIRFCVRGSPLAALDLAFRSPPLDNRGNSGELVLSLPAFRFSGGCVEERLYGWRGCTLPLAAKHWFAA